MAPGIDTRQTCMLHVESSCKHFVVEISRVLLFLPPPRAEAMPEYGRSQLLPAIPLMQGSRP